MCEPLRGERQKTQFCSEEADGPVERYRDKNQTISIEFSKCSTRGKERMLLEDHP